jgi:hypothetical protein
MEQVVLKPQNLPEQKHLFVDSPPIKSRHPISDHFMEEYHTHPFADKVIQAV